ncbi:MAG: hypothetical protein ACR2HF_06855, partial [Methylococcaceae bacterium]
PDGATQVALPSSFDLELPSVKFTLLNKTVLLGFGDNLTVDTPEALADYIDPRLPPLSATLPSLDLDAALAGEFKTYTPTGDEISIDVTDGDSWKNGLLSFIQFIPDSYHLNDPELTGKLFGFPLDYTVPLEDIAPQVSDFTLSDLLPDSVYSLIEPFIDPDAATKNLSLPTIDLNTIGSSVPVVDQFLELLKAIPSEIHLYDPTLSANVFSIPVNEQVVPLSTLVSSTDLGVDFLSANAAEGYVSFNLMDILPDSAKDLLGYFIDTESAEPLEVHIPNIDFGTIDASTFSTGTGKTGTNTLTAAAGATDTAAAGTEAEPADWISLARVNAGTAATNEIQHIDLGLDTAAQAANQTHTIKLALGTDTTAPIEVLNIGAETNEVQQLTIKPLDQLSPAVVSKTPGRYTLEISYPTGTQAPRNQSFQFYFGQSQDTLSTGGRYNSNQSTQGRYIADSLGQLLGIKGQAVASKTTIGTYTLGGITVQADMKSPLNHQTYIIRFADSLLDKLGTLGRLNITANKGTPSALQYTLNPIAPPLTKPLPDTYQYTVSIDQLGSFPVSFTAPASEAKADIDAAMNAHAASLKSSLEHLLGVGNVTVQYDTASKGGWHFDIAMQNDRGGKDIAPIQVVPTGSAADKMLLTTRTLTEGSAGVTVEDQARLLEEGLNLALGSDATRVLPVASGGYQVVF